ncbi:MULTISPECIES: SDR family NAD(P)-dependent oxidoreductase [unclassified Pseudovibrio]|uniref:SDR family NAD(P)-dependent oxidoreductase n=1 Tax=unclassified Pseudovibrio TaxID=2627060 RepID=UPI0007AE6BAB|nr:MULTISPECIES: SDR family NAD(P)-dependent oxidoreductase [unclassified Pseudovibrio]KZK96681.1 D-beta-hydroxybutyrate dehydrogenase [Pseudovibrio sp. Ad5]KZK98430.1 D-beta-hydroxybutyrate dehydrogenase [Pseudovibrio sp. W74]KZL08276.1 D-beta-hydroxybutyrate dehydrogenase [Pseudovibrio sp. Ad14]
MEKHALITGGGTGVGAEIARHLAGAGINVTIAGRRREPLDLVASANSRISAVTADITDEVSVGQMFEKAAEANGPVNIVIANAGAAESALFGKIEREDFQRMLDINLTGTFLTFQKGLECLKGQEYGRLIAIASTAGLRGYSYVSHYAAAKHGVIGMVRSLALELASKPFTVNAVCPGFTETPMLQRSIENIMQKTGMNEEQARAALYKDNPQQRFIQPDEVAATVAWLIGDGARSVTGQAISVSGGETQ